MAILTVLTATALWLAAHPIYEVRPYVPNLGILWSAHFGTGLFGTPDVPGGLNEWAFRLSLPVVTWCGLTTGTGRPGPPSRSGRDHVALLNTAVAGVALLLTAVDFASAVLLAVGACVAGVIGTWRRRDWPALREGAGLVTVGVLVVVVGVAHVASGPLTVPGTHGVGDRLYAVSSIGGAVVLVGLGQVLWRWWRPAAVIAAAVALGAFVHGQLVVDAAYAAAARDARAVLAHLATQADHPEDHDVVLDRVDAHTGVAAFDDVSLRWAVVALHGPGRGSARVGTPEPDDGTTPEVPDLVVSWDDAVGSTP